MTAGGGMSMLLAVMAIAYVLILVSEDVPLPVPQGMFYFKPNGTQALLLEGKRLDETMMLAAAEQKQKAIAAAEAMLLAASKEEAVKDEAAACDADIAARGLSVMMADPSAAAAAAFSLNFSRALMVYDLVFDAEDAWLGDVVDRVQLWNKLFLRQRAAKGWRVSLLPAERQQGRGVKDEAMQQRRKGASKELEDLSEDEQAAALSAQEAKREAAAAAKDFLESMVEETQRAAHPPPPSGEEALHGNGEVSNEDFTPEELDVLAKLFLSHEEDRLDREREGLVQAYRRERKKRKQGTGFQPVPVHVILVADNGTYTGTHELTYVYAAMRYKTAMRLPPPASPHSASTCVDATFGFFKRPVRNALTVNITHHAPVPVLAITTGASSSRAAACTAYVLSLPMFDIQSMTFMGTASVSPVVGGGGWHPSSVPSSQPPPPAAKELPRQVLRLQQTPEYAQTRVNLQCQSEWEPWSSKVALGSVCVTYAAVLQECGICLEENPVLSLCSRPRCTLHNSTTYFGPCNFQLSYRSKRLAERMKGAMVGRPFPPVPPAVLAGMERFWAVNEAMPAYRRIKQDKDTSLLTHGQERIRDVWLNGWGERTARATQRAGGATDDDDSKREKADDTELLYEYLRDAPTKPLLLNCAEVDTSQIISGVRNDALCREYAHTLLHYEAEPEDWEARKRQLRRESGEETAEDAANTKNMKEVYPRSELTCVQAMEGFGFLHVLIASQFPHIPVALVRAGARYDMYPLRKIVRPVVPQSFMTREEVLARLDATGTHGGNREDEDAGSPRGHAVLDVDGAPRGGSVGASVRRLHELFADERLSEGFATRTRLKLTADDIKRARADLVDDQVGASGDPNRPANAVPEATRLQDEELITATAEDHSDHYYVSWEQNADFMSAEEYEKFAKASAQYAVETASAVVLNFFLRDDGSMQGKPLQRP